MRDRGGRFFVMYGATEATARMAFVPPERLADKLGSAGRAIPGGSFSIRPVEKPETATVTTSGRTVGEVVYQGDNVMLGYATGADDLTLGDMLHGTLETGDIGYLDDEGYLFIVGRSKRIAKVYGIRINLDEVELRLRARGPAAVVAGPDAVVGYCAFGDDEIIGGLARDLAKHLRVNLAAIQLHRIEELPMLPSGKVDYQRLEASVPST
jgi:acyl-CoA synthetase (AMP-forming)/AMP-acid ligase II